MCFYLFFVALKAYPFGIPGLYTVILSKTRELLNLIHADPKPEFNGATRKVTTADSADGVRAKSRTQWATSNGLVPKR